ncbi:MAG: hypothetical protein HY649_06685 [Acidobacteria bacterium]|nr:hypothetical protein [Acidobacteriota bacterium]
MGGWRRKHFSYYMDDPAGTILPGIDPGSCRPLEDVEVCRKQGQFRYQGNGSGGSDARDAVQVLEAFLPERIVGDELPGEARRTALVVLGTAFGKATGVGR